MLTLSGWVVLALFGAGEPVMARKPTRGPPERFVFLPGSSCRIVGALSASPDTPVFGVELTPYAMVTAGVDFALFELAWPEVSLRAGFAGMYQFEEDRPYEFEELSVFMLPPPAVNLWRGQRGLQLTVALDGPRRWLGTRGLLEASVGYHHESEHHTGSEDPAPSEANVMNIGDWISYAVALRIPFAGFELDLRSTEKVFGESSGAFATPYVYGVNADAVLRWRLTPWLEPFTAIFAEYLWGNNFLHDGVVVSVPDAYLLRSLFGVIIPGRAGNLTLFISTSLGHARGERAYEEEALWGGGMRFSFF